MHVTEILLNTATIREINLTEIDSNFTARETQDSPSLQRRSYKQSSKLSTSKHSVEFILPEAYHLERLNPLYMLGTMLGFFIRPIRATENFLPKYGISGLSQVCRERVCKTAQGRLFEP